MQLSKFLSSKPKNNHFYIVAIDGRGGSGKTQFAEYLKTLLPDFIFISGDDYFEPVENEKVWGAFNDERFIEDVITPLKKGNEFIYHPYDWSTRQISSKKIIVEKGIVLDRCYSFGFDIDWDVKIWVETPRELCLERGIQREHLPREQALAAWEVWQRQEDEYIQQNHPMDKADIVIYGDKPFAGQLTF